MPRERFSRERIIETIQANNQAGLPLNFRNVLERERKLVYAALRRFGSWNAALEAAGLNHLDIRKIQSWTRERVIERLRYWHERGEDLSYTHVAHKLDPPLAAAVYNYGRFTSWEDALVAAGLDPTPIMRNRRWTPVRIAHELHALHRRGVKLTHEGLLEHAPMLLEVIIERAVSQEQTVEALGLNNGTVVQEIEKSRIAELANLFRVSRAYRMGVSPEQSMKTREK